MISFAEKGMTGQMKNSKAKNSNRIQKVISVISLVGFIACAIALLYPVISDRWNRYRDSLLIAEYNQIVADGNKSDYDEELKKARDYNAFLFEQGRNIVTDAEYDPDAYYETILNIMGNGMMGYVEIPAIDVTEPIYHYSTEVSLGEGIGHIHGSSLPVGGESTHSVLTGHRGLPNQKFFSDLDKIEEGDCFYVHVLEHTLAYEVDNIQIILPTEVEGLMIEPGEDLVTLVTCHPYGVNTHRLLVTGHRIPFDESNVEDGLVTTEEHKAAIDPAVYVFMGFVILIIILVVAAVIRKIISKRKKKQKS